MSTFLKLLNKFPPTLIGVVSKKKKYIYIYIYTFFYVNIPSKNKLKKKKSYTKGECVKKSYVAFGTEQCFKISKNV